MPRDGAYDRVERRLAQAGFDPEHSIQRLYLDVWQLPRPSDMSENDLTAVMRVSQEVDRSSDALAQSVFVLDTAPPPGPLKVQFSASSATF